MFDVIIAITLQFLILAVPILVLFNQLHNKPIKTKFGGTLSQEEAIEFRGFLQQLDDYLKNNTDYFGLIFANPILYEYIRYYIDAKHGGYICKYDGAKKIASNEYYDMRETYGEELFHSNDIKMNFLSFGYGDKIYFTSHGFVHFCKWIRENGLFDTILIEMYSTIALSSGCGISADKLEELVKLFDDVQQLSPEYEAKFKPFVLEELINLSQSIISKSSSSSSSSSSESDEDSEQHNGTSADTSLIANPSINPQIDAVLKHILAEVSKGIASQNVDLNGLEDIILQNSGKLVELLKQANTPAGDFEPGSNTEIGEDIAGESSSSDSNLSNIDNPAVAKEIEELDNILKSENAVETQSGGILSAIYALFGKSSYLSEDFGTSMQ